MDSNFNDLLLVWLVVLSALSVLFSWILVSALKEVLRRNDRLTMMLAVREAHGGKGADAARAQVATIKELSKKYDKAAMGSLDHQKPPDSLPHRMKQVTP
jgi:hypothetical protein